MQTVTVQIPATSANLGPGFDTLGLALDLWNQTTFSLTGKGFEVNVQGEGQGEFPLDETNLVVCSFLRVYQILGKAAPAGLKIASRNQIPPGSGLGSSAAAALSGILAANALLGNPLNQDEIIAIGTEIEGHPDNLAPALLGGFTLTITEGDTILTRQVKIAEWQAVVVLPAVQLPTAEARRALPAQVSLADAVFNLSRSPLVVEAFRAGNLELLKAAMQDRLHQPYRLPLLPGAAEAILAAQEAGGAAALSGAGPSVVAFSLGDPQPETLLWAMQQAFSQVGVESRGFLLKVSSSGARVSPIN